MMHSFHKSIFALVLSLVMAMGQSVCACATASPAYQQIATPPSKIDHADHTSHHDHGANPLAQDHIRGNGTSQLCKDECDHCDGQALQKSDDKILFQAATPLNELAFASDSQFPQATRKMALQIIMPLNRRAPPDHETLIALGILLQV